MDSKNFQPVEDSRSWVVLSKDILTCGAVGQYSLKDVADALSANPTHIFTNIQRGTLLRLVSLVFKKSEKRDLDMEYSALSCVSVMQRKEQERFRSVLDRLKDSSDWSIRLNAKRILGNLDAPLRVAVKSKTPTRSYRVAFA